MKIKSNLRLFIFQLIASICAIFTFVFTFVKAYFEESKADLSLFEMAIGVKDRLPTNGILIFGFILIAIGMIVAIGLTILLIIKDSKDMINEIKNISLEVITRNITDKYVEYTKIKTEIREELGKYLYNETECKPMIIAVIQEV